MKALLLLGLVAGVQVRAQARLGAPGPKPMAFLVISSPSRGRIEYMALPDGPVRTLVDHGLAKPRGVAVNGTTLYVADPGNRRIEAYELRVVWHEGHGHLTAHKYRTLRTNVDAGSVAVGDKLYFTEPDNKLVEELETGSKVAPTVLFDGEDEPSAASPGGLALDGMDGLYWTNRAQGEAQGSLVSADLLSKSVHVVAQNVEATYGVCVSHANVFYSAADTNLWGVKRTGGAPVPISAALSEPRGCVYDTDGTIYLVDEGTSKVYAFPANGETLAAEELTEVASVEKPYGVAYLYYDPAKHVRPGLMQRFMEWWAES